MSFSPLSLRQSPGWFLRESTRVTDVYDVRGLSLRTLICHPTDQILFNHYLDYYFTLHYTRRINKGTKSPIIEVRLSVYLYPTVSVRMSR